MKVSGEGPGADKTLPRMRVVTVVWSAERDTRDWTGA